MRTIYKYHIPFGDEAVVLMPKKAKLLKFGIQGTAPNGNPNIYVWAMVDTDNEMEANRFKIFGTGQPLLKNCIYLTGYGTNPGCEYEYEYWDSLFDRDYVWHIFVGERTGETS